MKHEAASKRRDEVLVMLIVARMLAVLSVLFTLMAIEIWGVQYLPIGFEATLVLGGYAFWLGIMSAVSAVAIAVVRARSGKRREFSFIVLPSVVALLGLDLAARVAMMVRPVR